MNTHNIVNLNSETNSALIEKVILNGDLSCLNPAEKAIHVTNICRSLNLNPMTRPIQIMRLNGKEVAYVAKDATEQLRRNHKVSITGLDTKFLDGLYIVTANARTPSGRTDSSTGVVSVSGLKGDNLANAMLKCETKAKRRVTLSICGLGFLDESEVDSIRGAQKIDVFEKTNFIEPKDQKLIVNDPISIDDEIENIANAKNMYELKEAFTQAKRMAKTKEEIELVINTKDARKLAIERESQKMVDDFNAEIDAVYAKGEISQ